MGRVNTPELKVEQRTELENILRTSQKHALRMRCQAILLKADRRTSADVGAIVGMCNVSVNSWLKRYKKEGIQGLMTKPGRGRKPLITRQRDQEAVLAAIKANRQRTQFAKAEWEAQRPEGSKALSRDAFRSFLKSLVGDINESGDG